VATEASVTLREIDRRADGASGLTYLRNMKGVEFHACWLRCFESHCPRQEKEEDSNVQQNGQGETRVHPPQGDRLGHRVTDGLLSGAPRLLLSAAAASSTPEAVVHLPKPAQTWANLHGCL